MGLYNFMPQFVPYILDGSKTHTIRGERAHPDAVGNTMHLYTGLRQKGARLLMRAPCVRVESIHLFAIPMLGTERLRIVLDGRTLTLDEIEALAYRDGFRPDPGRPAVRRGFAGVRPARPRVPAKILMQEFWRGRLPFKGHVYHWRKP